MKHLILIIAGVILYGTVYPQVPKKFSYQAIIRHDQDELICNKTVSMKISLLQHAYNGVAVYAETQTPTTNDYGLVSLEIGNGSVLTGHFETIDWADGPYFIKTETDTANGTNYIITGVSQLLSVPYALNAGTVERAAERDPVFAASVAGAITPADTGSWNQVYAWGDHGAAGYLTSVTESDPLFVSSVSHGITTTDTAAWNRGQNQLTAGTGITITNNTVSCHTYHIGDFAQGGIVFWLDESGQHGLVCAKEDQNSHIRWHPGTYGNTQAKGDGPMAGQSNTIIIMAAQTHIGDDGGMYAARLCNELQITEGGITYSDWYLPSKGELHEMWLNMTTIDSTAIANGGSAFATAGAFYYSSTELNINEAWLVIMVPNYSQHFMSIAKNNGHRVRAVRTF